MRSTEAPVRSRACSSSLRAWLWSVSRLGTGCGDTGHQRKAAGPRIRGLTVAQHGHTLCGGNAIERRYHTLVMQRDCSPTAGCARAELRGLLARDLRRLLARRPRANARHLRLL